ncbi:MAG: SMP-30/gluconolactonase/LRE family protein [Chloroflexi bacterium]|nr:SMP-30/gluconolactonase/LRE family protein [Chloroflexota bacterium]MCH8114722.1 SMP-30/gluconolactonase/LRE family protein [Chloroflexota bacterium]
MTSFFQAGDNTGLPFTISVRLGPFEKVGRRRTGFWFWGSWRGEIMGYEVEKLASENALVGEGPMWDVESQTLYWIDIQGGRFWNYDPATGENKLLHEGYNTAGAGRNKQGGLTVATWEGVQLWNSDDDFVWLHQGEIDGHPIKLNDVMPGPNGSLFGGSGHLDSCTLFRFNADGSVDIIDDGLELCNGMGFSPDLRTFYSTDTPKFEIYKWDHNPGTGEISNKRVFATIPSDWGVPDGMTVDAEGFVWSAMWYGGMVVRLDPDGKEERRIEIPAAQTSSAMFGGKDLDELYVTTAAFGSGSDERTGMEPAGFDMSSYRGGDLFRVKLDIQGKPEFVTDFAWPAT